MKKKLIGIESNERRHTHRHRNRLHWCRARKRRSTTNSPRGAGGDRWDATAPYILRFMRATTHTHTAAASRLYDNDTTTTWNPFWQTNQLKSTPPLPTRKEFVVVLAREIPQTQTHTHRLSASQFFFVSQSHDKTKVNTKQLVNQKKRISFFLFSEKTHKFVF